MKRLISLLIVLLVVVAMGYGGLWYYGCMRLDQKLTKREFSFSFGPDKASSMSMKIERGSSRFWGWQQGLIGVEFDVRSMTSTSSIKLAGMTDPQLSTASFAAGDKPLVYRVGVPLWGRSLTLDVLPFEGARYEAKVAEKSIAFLQSGEATRATLEFKDAQFALSREKQIDALIADPKRMVEDVAGVDLVGRGKTFSAADPKAEVFDFALNGGGFDWAIGADGMLKVRYDLDMESKYGPGFAQVFGAASPLSGAASSDDPTGISASVVKLQQSLFGGASLVTKGALEVTVPANRVGLRATAAEGDAGFPVPPFGVKFEKFAFRLPFVFSSLTTVDGTAGFMWQDAKPISVKLTHEAQATDVQAAAEGLIKAVLESPQLKRTAVDTTRATPSSLTSLKEVVSDQGAFVLVKSSIQALSSAYFGQESHSSLEADVKTSSGNANVFELMGATGTFAAQSKLENGFGWDVRGTVEGAQSWKGELTVYELSKLLRDIREPLTLFAARSALATFFSTEDNTPPAEQESEFLKFVFSEELFNDLLAAFERVLTTVDQSPDSTSDLKLVFEGAGAEVRINGRKSEELLAMIQSAVMQEAQGLQAKLEPRLASLRLTTHSEAEATSDDSQGGAHAQWQQVPTEEGSEAVDIVEE